MASISIFTSRAIGTGPNKKACANGVIFDAVPYDEKFTCNCDATLFIGPNCADDRPSKVSKSSSEASYTTTGVVAGVLIAIIAIILTVVIVRKRRVRAEKMKPFDFQVEFERLKSEGLIISAEEAEEAARASRLPKELKRKQVALTKVIGSGAFGEVWKGVYDDSANGGVSDYLVGVKTLIKQTEEGTQEMLQESLVMAHIGMHKNVISLVGVVSSGMPKLLVMSFCENGN